jgi:hypothetical protein
MPALIAALVLMLALFQELKDLIKKPKYRSMMVWLLIILTLGTVFFRYVEGWSWVDALYFSVITLATIGFGDLTPTADISKIFTIFYVFLGLSVFVSFASMLARERLEIRERRLGNLADDADKSQ